MRLDYIADDYQQSTPYGSQVFSLNDGESALFNHYCDGGSVFWLVTPTIIKSKVAKTTEKSVKATPVEKSNEYDFRTSTDFRKLPTDIRAKIEKVVADFQILNAAVKRYMSDHADSPPSGLDNLIPAYLDQLPVDPFADVKPQISEGGGIPFTNSLSGRGYQYRIRPGSTYRAWQVKSVGLPEFPLRFRPNVKHSRGLVHSEGYWGRMVIDVF